LIRNRDNRKCQYPNCNYTDIGEKRRLDVHHIDGNKKNCKEWNLISLCNKHHAMVEDKSKQWLTYFYEIIESYDL